MATKKMTDNQILFIKSLILSGLSHGDVSIHFNETFTDTKVNPNIIEKVYSRHIKNTLSETEIIAKQVIADRRLKLNNSQLRKQTQGLLDREIGLEDFEKAIKELGKVVKSHKLPQEKPAPKDSSKKDMTIELMLSDIHYGKKVDIMNKKGERITVCDMNIIRKRVRQYVAFAIKDIKEHQQKYNVEKIKLLLLGDIIESYTFHGLESAISCEMGNSRQIVESVNSLFLDVVRPLLELNIKIDVECVAGNHDRTETNKTMNNPGENNVSWQIYKLLEMMCINSNFINIKFNIPINSYIIYEVYGSNVLVEHGDNLKGATKIAIESLVSRRASQNQLHIEFSRWGHFHEYTVFGRGKHIINGSVPGQDSYAEVLGYNSEASQCINYYVKTKNRPNCFYKSIGVYLD
jgi:predicted phosphodiesterase